MHSISAVILVDGDAYEAVAECLTQFLHTNHTARTPTTARSCEFFNNHLALYQFWQCGEGEVCGIFRCIIHIAIDLGNSQRFFLLS